MPSPVRLSVRPSVCLSVTRVDQSKTVEVRIRRVARIFVRGDTTIEGPKVPRAPSMGVWGHSPQKILEKSTLKLHIFLWF